jgi:hypothetical protein
MPDLNCMFDYELRLADLMHFNWNHMRKSRASQKNRLIIFILFLVVWVLLFRSILGVLIATVMFAFCVYLIAPIFLPLFVYLTYRKNQCKQMIGKMHVEFNNDCIREKTEVSESRIEWNCILSLEETKKHLFIYNSPLSAYIIPKTVFADNHESANFTDQIRQKIKMNRDHSMQKGT